MVWQPENKTWEKDPELARIMVEHGAQAPFEQIVRTDHLATAINREKLGLSRIVDLACGHKAVTRASNRMRCPTCQEMILTGGDYEQFRRRGFIE